MAIGLAFVDIVGDTSRTAEQVERDMNRVLAVVEDEISPVEVQAAVDRGAERELTQELNRDLRAVSAAVNPDATALLYAALAAEADVLPELRVEGNDVILGEMEHPDGTGYVWLINMTDADATATPRGADLVTLDGDSVGQVILPPFGVEVLRRA